MTDIVIEGTLDDVKRKLSAVRLPARKRVRVTISDAMDAPREPQEFKPTEFRNGVPLLPREGAPVTPELVRELLEEEDMEIIRAGRAPGR